MRKNSKEYEIREISERISFAIENRLNDSFKNHSKKDRLSVACIRKFPLERQGYKYVL